MLSAATAACSCLVNLLHSQKVVLDYGALSPPRQERLLEPRYRRILSFGDVLDESIGLYRRHWLTYALVSGVWLIPPGVVAVLVSASGGFDTSFLLTSLRQTTTQQTLGNITRLTVAGGLVTVVYLVFALVWAAAVLLTTDDYLHGVEPRLGDVTRRAVRRYLPLLGSILVYFVVMALLLVAAVLILATWVVVPPIGVLAFLAAVIALLIWAFRPAARTGWLKWLIIFAAPFGLPAYFGGLLSLYISASVLEDQGPIAALRRSRELVDRHWFRAVAILLLAGVIVSTMQYAPTLIVQIPLTISVVARGEITMGPTELAISTAASVVAEVLFASMGSIVYAVLFVDLRNRREGTDLAERLSQLEAAQPVTSENA